MKKHLGTIKVVAGIILLGGIVIFGGIKIINRVETKDARMAAEARKTNITLIETKVVKGSRINIVKIASKYYATTSNGGIIELTGNLKTKK